MREIVKNKNMTGAVDVEAHQGQVKYDKVLALFRLNDSLVWAAAGKNHFSDEERNLRWWVLHNSDRMCIGKQLGAFAAGMLRLSWAHQGLWMCS